MKIKTLLELKAEMLKFIDMAEAEIKLIEEDAAKEDKRQKEIDKMKEDGKDTRYMQGHSWATNILYRGEIYTGTRASGSIRRKSMDISNLLVDLRKGV